MTSELTEYMFTSGKRSHTREKSYRLTCLNVRVLKVYRNTSLNKALR